MTQPPPRQFSGIFISYRREDSAGHAGRLYDRLSAHFGDDQVFMDIDRMEPGDDFVKIIEDAVGSCDVLLAVIGRRWLSAGDDTSRRLDNPNDFVRLEIAAALRRNIRVIPVLVQGAAMPKQDELPAELSGLSRRHALELSDLRWKHDVEQLLNAVERILARQQEARRRAQEEEEQRLHEEEAQRQRAEEAARRQREAEQSERIADSRTPPPNTGGPPLLAELPPSGAGASRPARGRVEIKNTVVAISALVAFVISISLAVWQSYRHSPDKPETVGVSQALTVKNRFGMEFVWIPPGSFKMGSENGHRDEKPAHDVTIGKGFYMGKYEVTQAQWQSVIGNNPAKFKGCDDCPVEGVSWDMAKAFVGKLNEMRDAFHYRLPTEAEWEYAARAGTSGEYVGDVDGIAWYGDNAGRERLDTRALLVAGAVSTSNYDERLEQNGNKPHRVGSKRPNAFGLFDMIGNVWEWCEDNYSENYEGAPTDGSARTGLGDPNKRITRGGSCLSYPIQARAAYRGYGEIGKSLTGLRLVVTVTPP